MKTPAFPNLPALFFATAGMLFAPAFAQTAADSAGQKTEAEKPLVVLELFTSQGCYSCPPAEKLVDEVFTKTPGLLPLEMHVDYWDDLVYGFHGSWKDPFSSRQFSERQFSYNRKLRGSRGGYTPQMIVQGGAEAGGSRRERILQLARLAAEKTPQAKIQFTGDAETGFAAQVEGAVDDGMQIAAVVFLRRETTVVDAGENDGKTLVNSNVVTDLRFIPATSRRVKFPALDAERESCAVWLQRGNGLGAIVAAARCPES